MLTKWHHIYRPSTGNGSVPKLVQRLPVQVNKRVRTMRFNCVAVRHFQNDRASFSAAVPSKPIQWGIFPKQCLLSDMPNHRGFPKLTARNGPPRPPVGDRNARLLQLSQRLWRFAYGRHGTYHRKGAFPGQFPSLVYRRNNMSALSIQFKQWSPI
jgi:hypothetical protein